MSRPRLALCLVALAAGLLSAGFLLSESAADEAPDARALLTESASFIEARKSFMVTLKTTQTIESPQASREMQVSHRIAAEAPNRIHIQSLADADPREQGAVVSDGEKLYAHLPALKAWSVTEAPATFNEVMAEEQDPDLMLASGQASTARMLMTSKGIADMMLDQEPQYVGLEKIGDQEVHRLRMYQKHGDDPMEQPGAQLEPEAAALPVDVWIQAGDQPIIRRVQPDIQALLDQQGDHLPPHLRDAQMTVVMELADWQIDQPLDASLFQFDPPADHRQRASVMLAMPREPRQAHELEGKPAPAVELNTVEGKPFKLADEKAGVVVLNFWATWCGPCVAELPGLQGISDWAKRENKDLAIYAINLQEEPGHVRTFWQQLELTMPILMDTEGRTARAYQLEGPPQTVIIADGKVVRAHVGYYQGMEHQLRREIDALLKD